MDLDIVIDFNEFINENLKEVCLDNGVITYLEDMVHCSTHSDKTNPTSPPKEVPWL